MPTWYVRASVLRIYVLCAIAVLIACQGPDPDIGRVHQSVFVEAQILGAGAATDQLVITADINGVLVNFTCMKISDMLTTCTATDLANGQLQVAAKAFDGDGCIIASGMGGVMISGAMGRISLTLSAVTPRQCPLVVEVRGSGTATMPDGTTCRTRCTTYAADGTRATLGATPGSGRIFAGWPDCPGVAPCATAIHGRTQVIVSFGTWSKVAPNHANSVALWGSSSTDLWSGACCEISAIFHWDGVTSKAVWSGGEIYALWGTSRDDVWAGGVGYLLHWDGITWSMFPLGNDVVINSIWGMNAKDVWAVGSAGFIAHWDGALWKQTPSGQGTLSLLWGVWGNSSTDVWATGPLFSNNERGILHWDGVTWSLIDAPVNWGKAIWGSGTNDVWFASALVGFLYHWDGKSWTVHTNLGIGGVSSIWGSSSQNIWGIGSGLYRFTGEGAWTLVNAEITGRSIWAAAPDDIWVAGDWLWHFAPN